jgi:hypothetical protein
MEGPEKIAALHDVSEEKGVSAYGQDVSRLYTIQIQGVTLKVRSRGEKRGAALHDTLETKGASTE